MRPDGGQRMRRGRVMHQGLDEPEADFRARVAKERAAAHQETLWICVAMECVAE